MLSSLARTSTTTEVAVKARRSAPTTDANAAVLAPDSHLVTECPRPAIICVAYQVPSFILIGHLTHLIIVSNNSLVFQSIVNIVDIFDFSQEVFDSMHETLVRCSRRELQGSNLARSHWEGSIRRNVRHEVPSRQFIERQIRIAMVEWHCERRVFTGRGGMVDTSARRWCWFECWILNNIVKSSEQLFVKVFCMFPELDEVTQTSANPPVSLRRSKLK